MSNSAFAGYSYQRSITVNASQVNNNTGSLTQFPVLVCGNASSNACNISVANMATVAHGGHVQNSSGYDIIFTTDSGCSNKLNWEMENYNATTGEFEAWVSNSLTALSGTSNTTFYMCYGNAPISTFQSTASSVWDSNYAAVWHFPNGSTLTANDSTSNSNTGTITNASATSGQVDGTANFNGTNTYIQAANREVSLTSFTISGWVKSTANTSFHTFFGEGDGRGGGGTGDWGTIGYGATVNPPNVVDGFYFQIWDGGSAKSVSLGLADTNWHYLVGTYNSSTKVVTGYVDGGSPETYTIVGTKQNDNNAPFLIGAGTNLSLTKTEYMSGTIDEVPNFLILTTK